MEKLDIALVIVLPVLDWLRDNWFQSIAALFMLRVWFGLGDLIDRTKRVESELRGLTAVTERVAGFVHELTPSQRKITTLMNKALETSLFDDGPLE
jgi:hypothetical protein